jgi:hypothetical protein
MKEEKKKILEPKSLKKDSVGIKALAQMKDLISQITAIDPILALTLNQK